MELMMGRAMAMNSVSMRASMKEQTMVRMRAEKMASLIDKRYQVNK
jgi:hypothetical protein